MDISMTTDFGGWYGPPIPQLRLIAEAGFSHLHWCHHFNSDFVYLPCEIAAMHRAAGELGLKVLDVHGSYGQEKRFWSLLEYEREAGVELIRNRAELYSGLEATGALIMHLPYVMVGMEEAAAAQQRKFMEQAIRSLDEVMPYLETLGVDVAFENMPDDNWELLDIALERYPKAGICYDSGHGNLTEHGQEFPGKTVVPTIWNDIQLPVVWEEQFIENVRPYLINCHLHDNDGISDQHNLPGLGIVDWKRIMDNLANAPRLQCIQCEVNMAKEGAPTIGKLVSTFNSLTDGSFFKSKPNGARAARRPTRKSN